MWDDFGCILDCTEACRTKNEAGRDAGESVLKEYLRTAMVGGGGTSVLVMTIPWSRRFSA